MKSEIKVLPTKDGYKIKVKRPNEPAVIFELLESELETFKTEVLAAWWIKHKTSKNKTLNIEENAFSNNVYTFPQNWLINKFK